MLESLEQEYRRDEDWCGGHDKLGPAAETDHVLPLISKHLEQKEAFLKVRHLPPEGQSLFRDDPSSQKCNLTVLNTYSTPNPPPINHYV